MLLADFYTIDILHETAPGEYAATVTLNATHPLYAGHFPGNPVVPGVCTLQIIKECCEQAIGRRLMTSRIASCKFTSIIRPDIDNRLEIALALSTDAENNWNCRAEVRDDTTTYMKLKATYIAV